MANGVIYQHKTNLFADSSVLLINISIFNTHIMKAIVNELLMYLDQECLSPGEREEVKRMIQKVLKHT